MAARRRRRRHDLHRRGRAGVRARRRQPVTRARPQPAAVGERRAAAARRTGVRSDGRIAGPASAQPLLPHGAHERALLFRRRHLVVRRRDGPHALLRLRGRRAPFPRDVPEGVDALWRRASSEVQTLVRRVLPPAPSQRGARHRRHLLRRPGGSLLLRSARSPWAIISSRPTCRSSSEGKTFPLASASAASRPTAAAATWNSTWSTTAAPSSACNPAAAPSRS